jgi:hypothetical protein
VRIEPPFLQQLPGRLSRCQPLRCLSAGQPYHPIRERFSNARWFSPGSDSGSTVCKQIGHMGRSVAKEAGKQRIEIGIGFDRRGVDVQLAPPHQAGLLAQVDDLLEEALEDVDPEPLPDAGQARMVRQHVVQGVPQIPAMGQVEAGCRDELALGPDPLEEHDELQFEVDDRVDARAAALRIEIADPFTDEAQVEIGLQVTVEVVLGNERLQ